MRLLVLDNYDSFTYNLVHLIEKVSDIGLEVFKNDAISISDIANYDKIMLSPGPGLPSQAGIMPQLIKEFHKTKPIFGVCLGFQAIGEFFGSPLKNLPQVFHGMATPIKVIKQDYLFKNCPSEFLVGRYHSWVIDEKTVTKEMTVTAVDKNGLVMAARHNTYPVCGVQFHPESILSEFGETIVRNWLDVKNIL